MSSNLALLDNIRKSTFETEDLRKNLAKFLNTPFETPGDADKNRTKIGNFTWGAYAFYDYDGEPIYVGQTNERIRTRIGRHLTNQRTDAVAMSVLDPFEVFEVEVWPLPQFQGQTKKSLGTVAYRDAQEHLNALECLVYSRAVERSVFKAVLNEKDPPLSGKDIDLPASLRMCLVSREVSALRSHPDFRIARRALIVARLAQVISERKVQGGLRRVLLTQAKRLQWLAQRRYFGLGGADTVEREEGNEQEADA